MAAHTAHQTGHSDIHTGQPRIKVPYSKNPVFVAEGYTPPVVAGRSFEYETTPENVDYWQTLSLAYRQYLKKEADTRAIDLRLLLDKRRTGEFPSLGVCKRVVMRELFANGNQGY